MNIFVDCESIFDTRAIAYRAFNCELGDWYYERLYEEGDCVGNTEWSYLYNKMYDKVYANANVTDIFTAISMELVNVGMRNTTSLEQEVVNIDVGIKNLGLTTSEQTQKYIDMITSRLPVDGIQLNIDVVDNDVNDINANNYDICIVYRGLELLDRITFNNMHKSTGSEVRIYTPALLKEPMVAKDTATYDNVFNGLSELYAGHANIVFLPIKYWCELRKKEKKNEQ